MAILFIVSFLILAYFMVATINNKVVKQKGLRNPTILPAPKILGIAGALGIVFSLFFWLFVVSVGPQEVAVVKTPSGVKEQPLTTGWHIIMPWWETYPMDKTLWVYTFAHATKEGQKANSDAIWSATSKGIKMGFDVSISWKIDPNYAPWICQNVSESDGGPDGRFLWIEDNIIRPKTKSVFTETTPQFTPDECFSTGREKIKVKVIERLKEELGKLHLILDEVDLREVFYDPTYEAELKRKQVESVKAETEKEITKQLVERENQAMKNKNIAITAAEGEAEALRIKGNAINQNPKIILLEWIAAWKSGGSQVPRFISNSGSNSSGNGQMFMLNLDMNK